MASRTVASLPDLAERPRAFDGRTDLLAKDSLTGATIAFDLDGTLVDTASDLIGVLNQLLQEAGLKPVPLAAARHLVGGGARALLEHGFAEAGEVLDPEHGTALFQRFIAVYATRIAQESQPYPGCGAMLDDLEQAGANLCVCTNKLTGLSVELLRALDMEARFASIVGPDATTARKPNPQHLFTAIQQAGGDPARTVFVGDSRTDLLTARAAGIPIVGVSFGYTDIAPAELGFDVLIDALADLPQAAAALVRQLDAA